MLSEGDAANFLEQVSSNPQLASFMQTPINCVNACALYRFGKTTLPRTTTAMVSEMLRLVVKQKEEKITGQAQTDFPKQWQDVAAHLRQATDDLACFAFFRLINQCVVFREKDFQQHGLSQEALALGLLESCCDMQYEGIEQQRFAHLIMQESLAARHVIKTVTSEDDLDWLVSELGPLTGHLNAFYRCLAAELQTESGVDALVQALLCVPTSASSVVQEAGKEKKWRQDFSADFTTDTRDQHCPLFPIAGDRWRDLTGIRNTSRTTSTRRSSAAMAATPLQAASSLHHPIHRNSDSELRDVTNITTFLWASYEEISELANQLCRSLEILQAEEVADQLYSDLTSVRGNKLVYASPKLVMDDSCEGFLREMLLLWVYRFPKAHIRMLYDAVATVDQNIAATYFPTHNAASQRRRRHPAFPARVPSSLKTMDLATPEGKQRLLLALRCYQEFSISTNSTPLLPSLHHAMENFGMNLEGVRLTASDCSAVGLALRVYNDVISEVDLYQCLIGDTGYAQLASGLQASHGLTALSVAANDLSSKSAGHLSTVISSNNSTLQVITTSQNNLSSQANAELHQYTHQCKQLQTLLMGGTEVMNSDLNIQLVMTIVSRCPQLCWLDLCEFSLSENDHTRLLHLLENRTMTALHLMRTGLSVNCAAEVSAFLHRQRRTLRQLNLTQNNLSDGFLFDVFPSLSQSSWLVLLDFSSTQLTSVSLLMLANLIRRLPFLSKLRLAGNDFSAGEESCTEFVEAVLERSSWRSFWMPKRELVNSRLQDMLDNFVISVAPVQYVETETTQEWRDRQLGADAADSADSGGGSEAESSDADDDEDDFEAWYH